MCQRRIIIVLLISNDCVNDFVRECSVVITLPVNFQSLYASSWRCNISSGQRKFSRGNPTRWRFCAFSPDFCFYTARFETIELSVVSHCSNSVAFWAHAAKAGRLRQCARRPSEHIPPRVSLQGRRVLCALNRLRAKEVVWEFSITLGGRIERRPVYDRKARTDFRGSCIYSIYRGCIY